MDHERKVEIHNDAGRFSDHLDLDIVQLENRILQTNQDMEEFNELLEDLKARKDEVYEDAEHEGLTLTTIKSYSEAINHLNLSIAHMNQKREGLNLALNSARLASGDLTLFANAIPGIPTIDDESGSD